MLKLNVSAKNIPVESGVYAIINTRNNKYYIGSTNNFKLRFIKHRRLLRANKHHSKYLQNAYNKYTESAFVFVMLEKIIPTLLMAREQYYLDLYQSYNRVKGYNIATTAYNNTGIIRTFSYKFNKAQNTSVTWYLVTEPNGLIHKTKTLRYFTILDSNGIKKSEKCVKNALYRLALGTTGKTDYYGWHCAFLDKTKQLEASNKQKILIERKKEKIANAVIRLTESKIKTWEITFPTGEKKVISNLSHFAKQHKLTNVFRAAKLGYSCSGFTFKRLN